MNWRELITDIFESKPQLPDIAARPKFYPGATAHEIAKAAARLNADFPVSLRSVLRQSNGVMEMIRTDGGRWHNGGWILWAAREIVKRNLFYRAKTIMQTYDRDFRKLFFFAGREQPARDHRDSLGRWLRRNPVWLSDNQR